jgi:hypothetical protein
VSQSTSHARTARNPPFAKSAKDGAPAKAGCRAEDRCNAHTRYVKIQERFFDFVTARAESGPEEKFAATSLRMTLEDAGLKPSATTNLRSPTFKSLTEDAET